MSMRRKPGRGSRGRGKPSSRRRLDFEEEEEAPSKRRRGGRKDRGGKGGGGGGKGGFDWSVADDEERDDDYEDDGYDERDDDGRESRRPTRKRRAARPQRQTLMDLCTPVFGHLAILPAKAEDPHPPYQQFRTQIVEALDRIQREAPNNGIEAEDANQASYALCFLADTLVGESAWNGKLDWSGEPLGIVRYQDPEGGRNFFNRLEAFGERQRAVKEVYLVCLSLGFRGQYAELEPTQQAAKLADIRQGILREVIPESLEKLAELFPEAYEPADAIEDEVPPAPRWWWFASLGTVAAAIGIWMLLFFWAGSSPRDANGVVETQLEYLANEPPPKFDVVEETTEGDEGVTP